MTSRSAPGSVAATLPALGLHHVRLPVSDVAATCAWYVEVLGFAELLIEEEESRIVGAVLVSPTGVSVGLHLDPARAAALSGFAPVAWSVTDDAAIGAWTHRCDRLGVPHGPITRSETGTFVDVDDPDGIVVRLRTAERPSTDTA